jgi:hypothetical protein
MSDFCAVFNSKRKTCKILFGKLNGKRPLWRETYKKIILKWVLRKYISGL